MKYEYFLIPLFVFGILGMVIDNLALVIIGLLMLPAMFIFKFIRSNVDNYNTNAASEQLFKAKEITKFFVGKDNLTGIGINEERNEIAVLSRTNLNEEFKLSTYSFEDLFEVKLIEDSPLIDFHNLEGQ